MILKKGKVIKSTGSWYQILSEEGETVDCRIIGKFRLNGLKLTNPVAVGDDVEYVDEGEEEGLIKKILPRQNYVVRQSPRKKHNLHLIASNVDQAVLVITIVNPNLKQGFIDRFLMMTEPHDIPAIIVFNKSDLFGEEEEMILAGLIAIYESIGYVAMAASSVSGEGIAELKAKLEGKVTLISGQSGVGKSTLINAIDSGLELRTEEISDSSGKGQHTTTFAEMFKVDGLENTFIIDTPGIKTLAFNNLEPMDVAHNFREFFMESENCKFGNCSHRNEPKCAVKEAVEKGEISELRYHNYLQIVEEIEDQNYWERHTDM